MLLVLLLFTKLSILISGQSLALDPYGSNVCTKSVIVQQSLTTARYDWSTETYFTYCCVSHPEFKCNYCYKTRRALKSSRSVRTVYKTSFESKCCSGFKQEGSKCIKDINECIVSNGGCDHQCRNTVGGRVCQCYDGFILNGNGKTCSASSTTSSPTSSSSSIDIPKIAGIPGGAITLLFIIALVIFFYKRKQRKSKQRNPRHHQGNGRVIQNQHVQPSLPTYQYFETENIGTVPSCPNYPPEEFNTELHVGVISYYPPPYVLHDPLQDY